ncbi:hypothetical protein EVAR_82431_1 [Eumeta japonica]|uniref:Uncharacterized protein n=1 Tax=Eumeta variegata TaxID=151549 RepID=A0A4C1YIA6_EUMVA|nr:hypothetical protein EVAR_82431_1 [Eumeta japonica]
MTKRVAETAPHGTRCLPPPKGRKGGGRQVGNGRTGKRKAESGGKLAKPATMTLHRCRDRRRHRKVPSSRLRWVSLKDEICRPSPSASTSTRPPIQSPAPRSQECSTKTGETTVVNRAAVKITALAREAKDELEALRNISREVKASVCEKLQCIVGLTLRLEESRSRHILEVERERAKRLRGLATLRWPRGDCKRRRSTTSTDV